MEAWLGIGGVLFGGILVAHFTTQYGIKLDSHTLHFVQEFGLILFVYTIGIQVGPVSYTHLDVYKRQTLSFKTQSYASNEKYYDEKNKLPS